MQDATAERNPVPATITTADGRVWTHQPQPFPSRFAHPYVCGTRRATLMYSAGNPAPRFISTSGKRLEVAA